eukprot:Nk52_evm1s995 gene=Nk52_evmTU1s995
MSSGHHAETDGQTERMNRTLEDMLRHYANYEMNNWSTLLPAVLFAYNSAKNASSGHSPFFLTHGYEPKSARDLVIPEVQVPAAAVYLEQLKSAQRIATDLLAEAQQRQEHYVNLHRTEVEFNENDMLYVRHTVIKPLSDQQRPKEKFRARWVGPFRCVLKISPVAYRLELPHQYKCHPTFHISDLRNYFPNDSDEFPGRTIVPPDPVPYDEDELAYEVEKLLDRR